MRIIIGENKNNIVSIYEEIVHPIFPLRYLFSYNIKTKRCKDFNKIASERTKRILKPELNTIKNLADIGYWDYLTIDEGEILSIKGVE